MIKSNELRIGNLLRFYNLIEPEKTITVNARFFSSLANGRSIEEMKYDEELNNYYSGIPITTEILKECGFKRFATGSYLGHGYTLTLVVDVITSLGGAGNLRIKYLHQLQNLYFALTNKELTVQEGDARLISKD